MNLTPFPPLYTDRRGVTLTGESYRDRRGVMLTGASSHDRPVS